jgi:hypothetical protein
MLEVTHPSSTTKDTLKDDFHLTNPFLLSSSPLGSVVRQKFGRTDESSAPAPPASPTGSTLRKADIESTSTLLKASADQASGALHQVGSNPASKLTKSTEEGLFASETEFSRLNFNTWVSQDSTSTISPAIVVNDGYTDLDKSTKKTPKAKHYGLDESYLKALLSAEIQTEMPEVGEEMTKEEYTLKPNAYVSDQSYTDF